jgi:hypothetical protein
VPPVHCPRAPLEDVDPVGRLHLANVTEALELAELRREAEEMTRRAEQSYPGRTTTIERDGKVEKKTVMYQDPPRVAWIRERRILTKDLWKAKREAEAGQAVSPQSTIPNQDSPAGNSGLGTPDGSPFALARPLARAEACDELTEKRWDAMDGGKRSCGKRCAKDHVASLPERAAYWRYQALGLEQGLGEVPRKDFVQILVNYDRLAVCAAAMVEAGGECRVGEGEGVQNAECRVQSGDSGAETLHSAFCTLHSKAPHSKRYYLELLLILDMHYSRRRCARIMAHFDEASGQFDWRTPAEDLRWVLEEDDEQCGMQSAECRVSEGMTDEIPNPESEIPNSTSPTLHSALSTEWHLTRIIHGETRFRRNAKPEKELHLSCPKHTAQSANCRTQDICLISASNSSNRE